MLDENLPAFILKQAGDGIKHHRDIFLAYQGGDPAPNYVLKYADPANTAPAFKNCYAAAIFDCYNPDVLYGEVLARPNWTQPTLSAEEIRRNGGIPPPPQPITPNEFSIQLYNPDQQIKVELKPGKWGMGSDSYEFQLPQNTFREPSASNIDRGQSDPGSLATTPKLNFVWRRESKLSKDLTCYLVGKSTDTHSRRARKDPDIAIALWRSMRELTVYEPNVHRLDLEDPKGMEVVLLLSAIVIKDLFFTSREHVREVFNVSDAASTLRKMSGGSQSPSTSHIPSLPHRGSQGSPPQSASPSSFSRPPPLADPRAAWELEAETARLRAEAAAEAREVERQRIARERADEAERQRLLKIVERERLERERADEAERLRLLKLVEQEEKEARKRQAEIDRETERLRKQYGVGERDVRMGGRVSIDGNGRSTSPGVIRAGQRPPSSTFMMSGGNAMLEPQQKPTKKKSFFGLRGS